MKLLKLDKKYDGKFLTYYIAKYRNNNNKEKLYEFISRNNDLTEVNFGQHNPCGVGIIPFSKDNKQVLLLQEFRMACNQWVYNFPTGLIDEGETAETAAKRELWEETGVELIKIKDILPVSYASSPTSDEAMILTIVYAEGEIKESTSFDEEIIAKWYSKEEIKELFKNNALMSVRTQIFLWNWINE